jgi:hypothetical protein
MAMGRLLELMAQGFAAQGRVWQAEAREQRAASVFLAAPRADYSSVRPIQRS